VAVVANDACLQTIPRTINTGMGALFILFALYFLGGETLTDFALALIVGILAGTYSSVFTASPLVVAFENFASRKQPVASARSARAPASKASAAKAGASKEGDAAKDVAAKTSEPKAAGQASSSKSTAKRKSKKSKKRSGKRPPARKNR
jgi:hypothetical protein